MKPQAILLFTLLRARAALSDESSSPAALLPDCGSPPCQTNLRAGASTPAECVRRHRCGDRLHVEEEGGNVARSHPDACVARCLRLRFGPARQEQCIEDCNEEGDRSTSSAEGFSDGQRGDAATFHAEERGEDVGEEAVRSLDACVARCLRLRFGPARREQCIEDCDEADVSIFGAEGSDDGQRGDVAKSNAEEGEEDVGEDTLQSPNACVARCLRLRFGSARQEQCINYCDKDKEEDEDVGGDPPAAQGSEPEADVAQYGAGREGEDATENVARSPNACAARCMRLRFIPERQEQCIKDCDEDKDDSTHAEYDAEEEGEEAREIVADTTNACVARCLRLRFGPARQQACIKNCDEDKERSPPVRRRRWNWNDEGDFDGNYGRNYDRGGNQDFDRGSQGTLRNEERSGPRGNGNACVARCLRLRFSPTRQEQCIADCGQKGRYRQEFVSKDASDNHEDEDYAATA